MKFSIQREILLKPLQCAASVADRRPSLTILGNVLLEVTANNQLKIIGSDSEIELTGIINLTDTSQPGATTVPARKFLDICRSLPDQGLVEVELIETSKTQKSTPLAMGANAQQLQIRCGRSRFLLATLPADEFPITPEESSLGELLIDQHIFADLLKKTHFAMAQQDVRHYLNGVLLDLTKEHVNVVATDGHRLALSSVNLNSPMPAQVIIPRKAVLELLKLLAENEKPARLILSAHLWRVIAEDYILTTKIIDSKFPDYQRVIPRHGDKEIVIDRDILKQALTRAAILSHEKHRGVRVGLQNNSLYISANNPEQEEAEEELEIVYDGKPMEIGFNVSYLIDVLNTIPPGNVTLTFSDENSSALLQGANVNTQSLYVVMPLRL